jgi:hypothetical protein
MMDLSKLKPLTSEQYDAARRKAIERIQARIGERPARKDFHRELGSIFTLLDVLALLVFVPALTVSSVHILQHMGALANASYPTIATYSAGTVIGRNLYTAVHQWATVPLAEASMLLFLVMFAMSARTWRKGVFFWLALAAILFVIIANVQSGLGWLESLLPPMFTIGIGLHLESLIGYLAALATWEAASKDAAKHPEYVPLLKQEVWARLMALTSNRQFSDAPVAFKHAAVRREMQRDTWAYEGGETPQLPPVTVSYQNGTHGDESEGEAQPEHPLASTLPLRIVPRPDGDGERA